MRWGAPMRSPKVTNARTPRLAARIRRGGRVLAHAPSPSFEGRRDLSSGADPRWSSAAVVWNGGSARSRSLATRVSGAVGQLPRNSQAAHPGTKLSGAVRAACGADVRTASRPAGRRQARAGHAACLPLAYPRGTRVLAAECLVGSRLAARGGGPVGGGGGLGLLSGSQVVHIRGGDVDAGGFGADPRDHRRGAGGGGLVADRRPAGGGARRAGARAVVVSHVLSERRRRLYAGYRAGSPLPPTRDTRATSPARACSTWARSTGSTPS